MEQLPYQTAVFPVSELVFFPNTTIPLNIYEAPYLKMLDECLKTKLPIAIIPSKFTQNEDYTGAICTLGRPVVLQENPDKTKLIVLQAQGKVQLHEKLQTIPFQRYNCLPIEEEESVFPENCFKANRLKIELKKWIKRDQKDSHYQVQFFSKLSGPNQLINYACTFLSSSIVQQQSLLEISNINQRLDLLLSYLEAKGQSAQENLH